MPRAPRALMTSATETTSSPDSRPVAPGRRGCQTCLTVRDASWILTAIVAHLRSVAPHRRLYAGWACSEGRDGVVLEPASRKRPASAGRRNSGPERGAAVEASDAPGLVGTHLYQLLPQELGWISSQRPPSPISWPSAQCHLSAQTLETQVPAQSSFSRPEGSFSSATQTEAALMAFLPHPGTSAAAGRVNSISQDLLV